MTVSQAETHYLDYFVIILNIIVILFLVALNGFFVASEFSIVKVRPSRLDTLIKEGSKSAVYARQVTEHLDAYLSVTQLGITLASLGCLARPWLDWRTCRCQNAGTGICPA